MRDRRVLLLAMSGVRVCDEELLRLGVTLPGFVERSRVIASLPSLGLLTLAAHTPAGWEVELWECDAIAPDLAERIAGERFDLVAISALSARVLDAYALADRLRAAGVRVVLGGLHASALPEEAARHVDAVVVGDGEPSWAELLADAVAGRLAPIYRPVAPFSLADARPPRWDLLDPARYDRFTLQTTRGCPRTCAFCGASRMLGPYRKKPLPLIERELDALLAFAPRSFIELADDNTFVDQRWAKELARLFAARRARWFTEADLTVADDDEMLALLAESGCAQILVGLESESAASLAEVGDGDAKRRERDAYAEKIARIQAHGISVNGCFVLGFDHDDPSTFERTAAFVRELDLSEVQVTLLTPFPGTALHRRLREEGRLLAEVYWDACTLFDVTYRPARMSPVELASGFRALMAELYAPEEVARRKQRFRACVRAGVRARDGRDERSD